MTDLPEKKFKHDAFLSYNSQDKEAVEAIARFLNRKGIKIWLDTWNLIPGRDWMPVTVKALSESRCVVVFFGINGLGQWEKQEVQAAIIGKVAGTNESIIPVLLPGVKQEDVSTQYFLGQKGWVKFQSDMEEQEALHKLLAGILDVEPGDLGPLLKKRKPRIAAAAEHLPFVNRESVIEFIFADNSPAYHLVDAPAGFGKSTMLNQLKELYEKDKKWLSCYVSIKDQKSASAALAEVASQLKLDLKGDIVGADIATELLQRRGGEFGETGKKGLIVFFDIEKSWHHAPEFAQKIIKEFIPGMADVLRGKEFRKGQHNPFRVVIAGRYLIGQITDRGPVNLAEHRLFPLKYHYIFQAVDEFLPPGIPKKEQLTAHLMYYTAGHPGCIAKILKLYKQEEYPDPDDFFDENAEQILDEVVYPEINVMRNGIAPDLRRVFDELSFFRFLDTSILRDLLERTPRLNFTDAFDLENKLRGTYLMDPWLEGRFLRDGITRELILLRFLSADGEEYFAYECQNARSLCQAKLQKNTTQLPDKWLLEYYYQYLQEHAGRIHLPVERRSLRKIFLDDVIAEGFKLFAAHWNVREFRNVIKTALDADWQFEFTANYFMRDDDYIEKVSDSPYEQLKARLMALVDSDAMVTVEA